MPDRAAFQGRRLPPAPVNEPVRTYAPGSAERDELKSRLASMAKDDLEIPIIIGGKEFRTKDTRQVVMPFSHRHVLAEWHRAEARHVRLAVDAANRAAREWSAWPWEDRAAVFLKAAEMVSTRWRATLNAATMLGQGKTVPQAEIDAACELADFWRFNVSYAAEIYADQPISSAGVWNQAEYRPLEGFVYAVTPFNFTAIAGNLPSAPALMGTPVVWKPAASAMLSAYYVMRLLEEAGLPPGVINFLPGDPSAITDAVVRSRDLAGIHFTGSTRVFQDLWQRVSGELPRYRSYPRLVGETGGKDFIVVHPSADLEAVAVAIARGGFEYQGQKCSAPSRIYVAQSVWPEIRERVIGMMRTMTMGDVRDFRHFVSAVIDRPAFDKISGYLAVARKTAKILHGGRADDRTGYYIEPTLVQTTDPRHRLMAEEIFGPVVTVYVFPDRRWTDTLRLVDTTSPYALTGAVFARDRAAVASAMSALRHAAGNFYINDKPTGAVVGQQPFGGARGSGTNDKAGSRQNLLRWVSARVIKETFAPPRTLAYPSMTAE